MQQAWDDFHDALAQLGNAILDAFRPMLDRVANWLSRR